MSNVRRKHLSVQLSSVQPLSHVQLFATPWTAARQAITNSQSSLKLMSIESVIPSNHLILCYNLLPQESPRRAEPGRTLWNQTSPPCSIWVYWGLTRVNWCLLKAAPPIPAPCGQLCLRAACWILVLPQGSFVVVRGLSSCGMWA